MYSTMYIAFCPTISGENKMSMTSMNNKSLSTDNNIFNAAKLRGYGPRTNGTELKSQRPGWAVIHFLPTLQCIFSLNFSHSFLLLTIS